MIGWGSHPKVEVVVLESAAHDAALENAVVAAARRSKSTYLIFSPDRDCLSESQLLQQMRFLDANPTRSFQNWLGLPDESGVPDESRYKAAEGLLHELARRGIPPPPAVMVRRACFDVLPISVQPDSETVSSEILRTRLASCLSFPLAGPEYVQIGPADACNARCLFCLHHSPLIDRNGASHKSMLQWDAWQRCIEDLADMKVGRVDYVGIGEPLMHPKIAEALRLGSTHFRQNMITNGLLIRKHIQAIAAHVDWLTVSLNAVTAPTQHFLHLTGEQGFHTTVEAIRQLTSLKDRRTQVSISFVVNKANFRQITALPAFCEELGVLAGLTPLGTYEETREPLGLSCEEERELFDMLEALASTPNHRILNLTQFRDFYDRDSSAIVRQIPCYVGLIFAQIRGDGSVSHCCACDHIPVGNIHEDPFPKIWLSEQYRRFRRDALFKILETQQPLPGCHCDICGFAQESLRVHNRIYGTSLTVFDLRQAAHAALS